MHNVIDSLLTVYASPSLDLVQEASGQVWRHCLGESGAVTERTSPSKVVRQAYKLASDLVRQFAHLFVQTLSKESHRISKARKRVIKQTEHLLRAYLQIHAGFKHMVAGVGQVVKYGVRDPNVALYYANSDGSSSLTGDAMAFVLRDQTGNPIIKSCAKKVNKGHQSSTAAELSALVSLLESTLGLRAGPTQLVVSVDAKGLVDWLASDDIRVRPLLEVLHKFEYVEIIKVPRCLNQDADSLISY